MKIQAKIPFTYLYPEEEPSEKRYWFKGTVTTVDFDGIYGAILWEYDEGGSVFEAQAPATLKITFDGVEYECEKNDDIGYYGAPSVDDNFDWSDYPFSLGTRGDIITQTEGEHTLIIEGDTETVQFTITHSTESHEGQPLSISYVGIVKGVVTYITETIAIGASIAGDALPNAEYFARASTGGDASVHFLSGTATATQDGTELLLSTTDESCTAMLYLQDR